MKDVKKIAFFGVASAIALVLSYIEAILPPVFVGVPGIKMGLANIVIIAVVYRFSVFDAAVVSAVRLIVSTMLFGGVLTFVYSLAGAVLSLIMMAIFKKLNFFSTVGVSIIGAISHNIGQIAVAVFLFERAELWYYMTILAISGTLSGVLIGILGALTSKCFKKVKL